MMSGLWKRAAAAALVLLAAALPAAAQEKANLGDPGPALEVLEWVKGDAVDLAAQKGKIVLLDFFSVNDPRVPDQVKHLNKLQEKHAAAGVRIVALAVETVDDVKDFVGKHEFKFTVGVDNQRNTIGSYGNPEPPLTVVIDKLGRIAWRGYVSQVDATLEKVVAGTWDIEAAKKTQALVVELFRQLPTNDPDLIQPAAEALLTQEPGNLNAIKARRFCFAKKDDAKGFREWIAKQVPKVKDPDALNELAWDLVTDGDVAWREPAAALAAAKAAVDATEGKKAEILDTLARAYCEIGLVDRAVAEQKRAIAALAPDAGEAEKKRYQEILGYYETCAALAKSDKGAGGGPAKPPKK
jgi:peroxiredoxin